MLTCVSFLKHFLGGKAWSRSTLIVSDSMCKYFPDLKNTDVQAFGGLTTQRLKWKIEQGHFNLDQYCNIIIHVGTNDVFHISSDIFYENMVSVVQE